MLNSIGIQMLELNPIVVKKPMRNLWGKTLAHVYGSAQTKRCSRWAPRLIFVAKYDPFIPQTLTWKRPFLTRPSMREWLMSERDHSSIGEAKVAAWGLSYGEKGRKANPNGGAAVARRRA
jgi:hypothetical protein